jgi:hypothetical protein
VEFVNRSVPGRREPLPGPNKFKNLEITHDVSTVIDELVSGAGAARLRRLLGGLQGPLSSINLVSHFMDRAVWAKAVSTGQLSALHNPYLGVQASWVCVGRNVAG